MVKAVCILGSPRPEGSTAAVVAEIFRALEARGIETRVYQLSGLDIGYCCGCKACEVTGECVQEDDVRRVMADALGAELVIVASPSYWGGVTGQMKVFIDRCTPYGNTNPARKPVAPVGKGVAVALRAGGSRQENMDIVRTVEHFLGHLDIPMVAHFTVEGIETVEDLRGRPDVLRDAYAFGERLGGLIG